MFIFFTSLPKGFQFDLYKNDTIKLNNANERKQGFWISFYNTGKINEEKFYDKEIFTSGQMFVKKGEVMQAIFKEENDIEIKM